MRAIGDGRVPMGAMVIPACRQRTNLRQAAALASASLQNRRHEKRRCMSAVYYSLPASDIKALSWSIWANRSAVIEGSWNCKGVLNIAICGFRCSPVEIDKGILVLIGAATRDVRRSREYPHPCSGNAGGTRVGKPGYAVCNHALRRRRNDVHLMASGQYHDRRRRLHRPAP